MNGVFLVLALVLAAYIWWRAGTAGSEERREENQREGFRQRIRQDPKNIGAYEGLGDSLRRSRRFQEAREAYVAALDLGSDDIIQDRAQGKLFQLDLDIRQAAEDKTSGPFGINRPKKIREAYFCPACGTSNEPHFKDCERCGKRLPIDSYWEALAENWNHPATRRATLEGLAIILVLAAVFNLFSHLPLEIEGVLIISATIVIGWRFLQAIEGRRH